MTFLNHKAVNFSSLMTINNIILSSLMTIVKEKRGKERREEGKGKRGRIDFTLLKKICFSTFILNQIM